MKWKIVRVKMDGSEFVIEMTNGRGNERQRRCSSEGAAMLHFMTMGESTTTAKRMIARANQ